MDKEKRIEELARTISKASRHGCNFPSCSKCGIKDTCKARIYATRAINAGYGNVKQAVKEFAEKLKENLEYIVMLAVNESWGAAYECINHLVKEIYGEDDNES